MKLGYVICEARGATDRLLSALAERLLARGLGLSGVVQTNTECADNTKCDMDLRVLPDGDTIRISQSLGSESRGCRLDPSELERAVALVSATIEEDSPQLLIVNKFGKHEADGRGFRPLIGEAMLRGIPVLAGVNGLNEDRFVAFSGGLAERIEPDLDRLEAWVVDAVGKGVADVA